MPTMNYTRKKNLIMFSTQTTKSFIYMYFTAGYGTKLLIYQSMRVMTDLTCKYSN
jgi:hypothetical protein